MTSMLWSIVREDEFRISWLPLPHSSTFYLRGCLCYEDEVGKLAECMTLGTEEDALEVWASLTWMTMLAPSYGRRR